MKDFLDTIGGAPGVALFVFFAGYLVRWGLDLLEARKKRRKFYIALVTEVRLNVDALDKAVIKMPPIDALRRLLSNEKDKAYRPHFISTYMSSIYDAHSSELAGLSDILTRNIIEFYGLLEYIDEFVRSFEKKSFESISLESRAKAPEILIATFVEASTKGKSLCDLLKQELGIPDIAS